MLRTIAARPLRRGSATMASRALSVSARLGKKKEIAKDKNDKTPGVPPTKILNEYEELREKKVPAEASVQGDIKFTDPKTYPAGDVGHDVLRNVGRHSKRTLSSFSMERKVCVVTGAARGLGNMMARTLVESGATQIVIVDLDAKLASKAASELTAWFEAEGQAASGEIEAVGVGCDVASEQSVKNAFQEVKSRFGRVDVLVTAAGIVENFAAVNYPTEKVRKLLDINVMGTWFCALEASKLMPEEGGSCVLIGSMSGSIVNIPQPQTPYNFSKAAVRHMARSLAVEWAPQNIRVNCISPGYMLTALTKAILDKDPVLRDTWISKIPQGRMGDPSDLKGAVVYLASDAAKYTTGSEIVVDGGYTCV